MPLKRLKEEYLEQDGVRFLMEDEAGNTVACRVSHEALRNHADRMHFSGTDGAVFETYRELIEEVASERAGHLLSGEGRPIFGSLQTSSPLDRYRW